MRSFSDALNSIAYSERMMEDALRAGNPRSIRRAVDRLAEAFNEALDIQDEAALDEMVIDSMRAEGRLDD